MKKAFPIVVGSVVLSLAGRDEGRRFLVMEEIDDQFVLVTNGDLRGIDRPKKKRRKHLKPTGEVICEMRERLDRNQLIENHEIRSWLNKEAEQLVQV